MMEKIHLTLRHFFYSITRMIEQREKEMKKMNVN
jgi:hypothetical protein